MAEMSTADGPDRPDRPDRRDRIRVAALELFATNGYQATTMADIGRHAGIRGPSIYRHYDSKQQLLAEIVFATMNRLIADHDDAVTDIEDPSTRLRRATEAHVRYHVHHHHEASVGNHEIRAVDQPDRDQLLDLRSRYENRFRTIIDDGIRQGDFRVESARLTSYAILDMGIGISRWYRADGPHSEDEIVDLYGDMALRLCGVRP